MKDFNNKYNKNESVSDIEAEGGDRNAPNAEADTGEPDHKTVSSMPSGDYSIHLHVQTGKNFVLPDEDTVDPYVQIEVLGEKKKSMVRKDITPDVKVNFNEHIFIDLKKVDNELVEEANIDITVLNKGFFKGDVIGRIQLSMSRIYHMHNHVMMHQRLGLTNPNGEDFSQMSGNLVVSLNIVGPNDEAQELKMGSDEDILKNKIIMPSSVKKQYKQLFLRVYKATNLPKMDFQFIGTGTIDAYLKLFYKDKKLKTRIIKQENNEVPWMQEFLIPVEIPVVHNKIILKLYDYDTVSDELAATTQLNVKEMIQYDLSKENITEGRCKWINLYGAPIDRAGKFTDFMNNDPNQASDWKGRICVEYWCIDHKYPDFKIRDIPSDFDRKLYDHTITPQQYQIFIEFGSGLCLPGSEKYKIKLQIADKQWKSDKPQTSEQNSCFWNDRYEETISVPYNSVESLPTFYIYLVDEDKTEVCFFRDSLQNYVDPNAPLQWKNFEPNKSHGVVTKEQEAGLFSFRLYIHDVNQFGKFNPKNYEVWTKKPQKRQSSFKARIAIYQCENLPPADETGHSDPYVQVYDTTSKENIRTEICEDTNNPIYYETKDMTIKAFTDRSGQIDFATAQPIILEVYDYDDGVFDSKDDLIGRAVIHLSEVVKSTQGQQGQYISFTKDEIPYPKWYQIKKNYDDEYDKDVGAAILVSIQIIEYDEQFDQQDYQIDLQEGPKRFGSKILKMPDLNIKEFKCEIIALGLRDLVSTGIMNVNKAYIKFAIKSLLPVSKANAIDNVFTQPTSKGPNPNIRTTIQFEVKMASDPTFLPHMTCEVFDNVFLSLLSQPSIGCFNLKLGNSMQQQREKLQNDTNRARNLIEQVRQVIDQVKETLQNGEDNRLRAAEVCKTMSLYNQGHSNENELTAQQKVGLALLEMLKNQGLDLPSTNAMRSKRGTQVKNVEDKDEQSDTKSTNKMKMMNTQNLLTNKEQSQKIIQAVGGNIRKKIQIAFETQIAFQKLMLEVERQKQQEEIADRPGAYGIVIKPIFKYDERLKIQREVEEPPESLFAPLGYNENPNDGNKHYRRFYQNELEDVKDIHGHPIISSPFIRENIYRAKPVKQGGLLGSLFSSEGGSEFTSINVGYFKGIIRCFNEKEKSEASQELKNELQNLLDAIIEMYSIEKPQQNCPIKSSIIQNLDDLEGNMRYKTLENIRQTIEDAGLEKLNIFPLINDISFQASLVKKLNEIQVCKVTLYMVDGFNFAQRDIFSPSDPYLKLRCGDTLYNERENYQLDTSCPKFFKSFQFQCEFPGSPSLEIEAYDYDTFFGDDLIGVTKIDLDDRFYSQSWQALEDKPIEQRDLYEESSTITQGVVKLWVEIQDVNSPEAGKKPINIDPEPVIDFECRVVVWKTNEIEMMDIEGTSDVFVRVFFDDQNDQTTDTHWRCQNGQASFNYRLLFPIQSQKNDYTLNIQAWDKDIIASNDIIGSCPLPLDYLVEDVLLTDQPKYINSRYFDEHMKGWLAEKNHPLAEDIYFEDDAKDKFWIPVHRRSKEDDKQVKAGEILVSVSIIPKKIADKAPQGSGRSEPNSDPFCPPPEGRIQLSLNPLTMWEQMVGPEIRRKIYMILLCIACALLCAMMAPMIFSNIITRVLVG